MPLFTLTTNIALDAERRQAFARHASREVASLLGKAENYVMVRVSDDACLLFAGNEQPCALLELKSLGLPEQRTGELSAALCHLVQEQLGIEPARIYIEFSNPPRHLWGWNGKTF